jgi:hypothetical protein
MKTNKQPKNQNQNTNEKTGGLNRSEQVGSGTDNGAPRGNARSASFQINLARRRANRELPTEKVLSLLQKEAPRFFELAEVVGKWVWVQFTEKQPREITSRLAELGFHWNNKRQVWQHPCGAVTAGTQADPREKYPTYFPADAKTA